MTTLAEFARPRGEGWSLVDVRNDPILLPELRDSLRRVVGFLCVAYGVYLGVTVFELGGVFNTQVALQAFRIGALAGCRFLLRGPGSKLQTTLVSLTAGLAVFATSSAVALVRGDMSPMVQMTTAFVCLCSFYVPWRVRGQAALVAMASGSVLLTAAMLRIPAWSADWFELLNPMTLYLALSVYVAARAGASRNLLRGSVEVADRTTKEVEDFASRLERQVEYRTAELRRRAIAMDCTIDGMAILRDDVYLYLNQAHARMYGYESPEELVGRTWRSIYDDEESVRLEREVFPLLGESGRWMGQTRGRKRDGSVVHTEISLTLTPQGDLICSCRDITLRLQIEAELLQSRDALELAVRDLNRANKAKDDFLATMSHELRTPLTAVLGFTEALQLGVYGPCTERQAKPLALIESSGQHLLQLISDVLELSKLQAGRTVLELGDFEVGGLIEEAMTMVRSAAESKKMRLQSSVEPAGLHMRADRRRIKQVMVNLLANAVKFTPEGGEVRVDVSADPAISCIRFAVSDTGIGIPLQEQSRLFQPFSQLDSGLDRAHEGTGLGLLLVRRFAELHHGRVEVESAPGTGSRFTVTLPWKG